MSKEIELTKGYKAIVDDDDYEWLNQWSWSANVSSNGRVDAVRSKNGKTVMMHREIMDVENPDIEVDHKDRDPLNNQKNNLRPCTKSQNLFNTPGKENTSSKYKGVYWDKKMEKWRSHFSYTAEAEEMPDKWWELSDEKIEEHTKRAFPRKIHVYVGIFDDEDEAARAYNKKVKEVMGEFAHLNDI